MKPLGYKKNILVTFFINISAMLSYGYTTTICYNSKDKLRFDKIFKIAFDNRKDLEAIKHARKASKNNEISALTGILPQLRIGATAGKARTVLFPSILSTSVIDIEERDGGMIYQNTPQKTITFELSQIIFSVDGPIDQYKIAKQDTYIIDAQKKQSENNIRFNSEASFLELQKTLLKNKVINSLNQLSKTEFDQRQGFNSAGFLNRSEWASAESTYQKEQSDIINYPDDVNTAVSKLERELNIPINQKQISLNIQQIDNIHIKPIQYYITEALKNRPELKEQYHNIKQAQYTSRFYKKTYVPELRTYALVTKAKYSNDNKPLTWNAGVRLDWSFDGSGRLHKGLQFENLETKFILEQKDLELRVREDVKQAYLLLKTLFNQLPTTEKQYKQTSEELERKTIQYQVGEVSLTEFNKAQYNNTQAFHLLESIKIDIKSSYQRLLFLCGYPQKNSN